jgi:hypothetical protein
MHTDREELPKQTTMAMHTDLKSNCWVPLLSASLPQLQALRQRLPPVADVYRMRLPAFPLAADAQLLISVNASAFRLHEEEAALVIAHSGITLVVTYCQSSCVPFCVILT